MRRGAEKLGHSGSAAVPSFANDEAVEYNERDGSGRVELRSDFSLYSEEECRSALHRRTHVEDGQRKEDS